MTQESGRIYHQGSLSGSLCNKTSYIENIGRNIVRKYKDPHSQLKVVNYNIVVHCIILCQCCNISVNYNIVVMCIMICQCCNISGCNWDWSSATANIGIIDSSDNPESPGNDSNTVIFGLIGDLIFYIQPHILS